jgi:putative PIN family toxin of toxin-antitoxin system
VRSAGDPRRHRHEYPRVGHALIGWERSLVNEALLVMAINQGLVIPCFSDEILKEYSGVLSRTRFGFPAEEVDALLNLFRRRGELLNPGSIVPISPDPNDDKFIACALAGNTDFLVTGNKRHFPQVRSLRARVVNAAGLLEFVTLEL